MRKIVLLLLIFLVAGSYTGCLCEEKERMERLWPKAERISFQTLEGDRIEFGANIYYLSDVGFLSTEIVTTDERQYLYLGWAGSIYRTRIYANSKEDPAFLFLDGTREVFLREGYDYHNDEFVIEGTDQKIRFSEAFLDTDYVGSTFGRETIDVVIVSTTYPALKANMQVFYDSGQWYAQSRKQESHALSDVLVSILIENCFISS